MEGNKKKRNSILKVGSISGKDDTNGVSERLKRISFSGKKSIRVFTSEDEAKTWDNSFEISDTHSNTSEEEKRAAGLVGVPQGNANLRNRGVTVETQSQCKAKYSSEPVVDKGNMFHSRHSISGSNESMFFVNTMEYIDKLQQSNIHYIENSVDVSLHDQEKVCELPSYSLCETEIVALRRRLAADKKENTKKSNVMEKTALRTQECAETTQKGYKVVYSSPVEIPITMKPDKIVPTGSANQENILMDTSALQYGTQRRKDHTHLNCYDMDISYLDNQNQSPNVDQPPTVNNKEMTNGCVEMNLTVPGRTEIALESSWFLAETIDSPIANKQQKSMGVVNDCSKAEQPLPGNRNTNFFADEDMDGSLGNISPAAVPEPIQSLTAANKHDSAVKHNGIIVTHRAFTPKTRAPLKVYSKYEGKEERVPAQTPAENSPVMCGPRGANDGSDFSLCSWSSPVIPPEYMALLPPSAKKPNLRQLNDAITRGEIAIFPGDIAIQARMHRQESDYPDSSRKKTCRTTLNFADQMEFSQTVGLNKTQGLGDLIAGEDCFEDTDIVLDNTSFYTKAKLDDETTFRNSTTQGPSSNRGTIYFNAVVDETLTTDNLLLPSRKSACEAPTGATLTLNAHIDRPFAAVTQEAAGQIEPGVGDVEKNSATLALFESIQNETNILQLPEDRIANVNTHVEPRNTIFDEEAMHLDDLAGKTNIVTNLDEQAASKQELVDAEEQFQERAEVHSKERKTTYLTSMCEGTPQRSMIDFETLEREIEAQDAQHKNGNISKVEPLPHFSNGTPSSGAWGRSPLRTNITNLKNKILKHKNLTPLSSMSKRRQTILFGDCKLDESIGQLEKSTHGTVNSRQTNYWLQEMDLDCGSGSPKSSLRPAQQDMNDSVNAERLSVGNTQNSTFQTEAAPEREDICANESKQEIAQESAVLYNSLNLNETHKVGNSLHSFESRIPVRVTSGKKETSCAPVYISSFDGGSFANSMHHSIDVLRAQHSFATNIAGLPDTTLNAERTLQEPVRAVFGDNTIVISDVSVHYQTLKRQATANSSSISPSKTKSKRIISPILSDEETANGMAKFAQNYINLTDYTLFHGVAEDNIDQTHLSLVSTLLDNETGDEGNKSVSPLKDEAQLGHATNMDAQSETPKIRRHSVCRKCRHCQDTVTEESFKLPPISPERPMEKHLELLRKLRQGPTIFSVSKHFQKLSLEVTSSNLGTSISAGGVGEEDPMERVDAIIKSCKAENQRTRQELESKVLVRAPKAFVDLLTQFACEHLPKWTIDCQLQYLKTVLFSHHKFNTFRIQLQFEEKCGPDFTCAVKSLRVQKSRILEKNWRPIDFLLEFQRKLEFPMDLMDLCKDGDENDKFNFMRRIDDICAEVAKLGFNLWKIACAERAALIRRGKMTFVQKTVRDVISRGGQAPQVMKTVFEVEVTDIKKLCFKDIVAPPLHLFREDIQQLSTGLDFLQVFLRNPSNYLK